MAKECRYASGIFIALLGLAGGKRQLQPLRDEIASVSGFSVRMVGQAIDTLHRGGWVKRRYGSDGVRTYYRIILPDASWTPSVGKANRLGKSRRLAQSTSKGRIAEKSLEVRPAHHLEANRRCATRTTRDDYKRCARRTTSPKGEGTGFTASPSLSVGDASDKSNSEQIERERLARIRAEREADKPERVPA